MNPDRLAFHVANKRCVELMDKVQYLEREVLRLRLLMIENTKVGCGGQSYWPEWVMNELGATGPLPGGE